MKDVSNVQVLRGLAALGVVFYHAQGELIYRDAPNPLPSLEWGAFGVDVFFVISGFVMAYASAGDFGSPRAIWPFAARRVLRIVPLYWIATLAFAILTAFGPDAPGLRAIGRHVLVSFAFVPSIEGPLLPPGWTLNAEMAFYLCFAAVLPFRRGPALAVLAGGLAAIGLAGTLGYLPERLAQVANVQILEFVAGLAIAEARLAGWRIPPRLGIVLASAALVAIVPTAPLSDAVAAWRGVVWGIPAAIIVGGLALARDVPRQGSGRVRRALERLGDASYSIYLTHFVVNFSFVLWLFVPLATSGPRGALIYFVILLAADAPACFLVYRYVEVPLNRRLRWRRRDRPAEPVELVPA